MILLRNNIEIFTLEKVHLDKIKEAEQQKAISAALIARGVDQAHIQKYYEDVDFGAFFSY